jgi:predicted DNA-binding protein
MAMKTLCLKLPEATAARLAATARKRSQSKSAVVRAILEEHLTAAETAVEGSCLELAADLAGCVAGPRDLSTHQRHLRGYGQ